MGFVRCPVVVGREEELTVLGEVLGAPEGGVCWVVGEAGIGKTRLVTELGRRARKAGRNVVTCRATQADWRTPYRPVTEALLMLDAAGVQFGQDLLGGDLLVHDKHVRVGAGDVLPVVAGGDPRAELVAVAADRKPFGFLSSRYGPRVQSAGGPDASGPAR
ncbi:MAG: AAA family ATPase [Pseudonocardiaceae bacterium]